MIGIDIVTIKRFQNKKPATIKRFLSPLEYAAWNQVDLKYLAVRWAIKEALYKVDNAHVKFNEITIEQRNGRYYYHNYQISTSREGDLIVAIVQKEQQC